MVELGPARQAHHPHKKPVLLQNQHALPAVTQHKELKFGLIFPQTSAFCLSDLIPSAIINTLLCLQLHK